MFFASKTKGAVSKVATQSVEYGEQGVLVLLSELLGYSALKPYRYGKYLVSINFWGDQGDSQ